MSMNLRPLAPVMAAIFALTALPAIADHETGHDAVARGGIQALEERVWDIEQTNASQGQSIIDLQNLVIPGTKSVDCSAAETIQAALDAAVPGDTIEVSGTCNEAVTINTAKIKLVGVSSAKVIAPAGSGAAIRVRAMNAEVSGFMAITGVTRGIQVERSGFALIRNNTIVGSGSQGIFIRESSSARIDNNTVDGSGSHGIHITDSSFAQVEGNNVVKNNGRHGIIVSGSASGNIYGNTITSNASNGILLADGGNADIDDNVITDNAGNGVRVGRNSSARLARNVSIANPNTFQRNGVFGVSCREFSSLQVRVIQIFGTGADANVSGATSIGVTDCALGNVASDPNF
ncbi:MAG: right-handed parallel beta-helix repeat-containing protein [Alphaproteobacteria bacterium]|nr:right-handed parallel beta-helix repeat-containing protein [Alphaproteobacteria bacterium]